MDFNYATIPIFLVLLIRIKSIIKNSVQFILLVDSSSEIHELIAC